MNKKNSYLIIIKFYNNKIWKINKKLTIKKIQFVKKMKILLIKVL